MAPDTPSTADAGPLAHEGDLRPAFAVDAGGRVVWAGPLARRLLDAGGLEEASAATLARLAALGAASMARLRFGALGRAAPLVVQTRQARLDDGTGVMVVEALSEIDLSDERIPDEGREALAAQERSLEAVDAEDAASYAEEGEAEPAEEAGVIAEPDVAPEPVAVAAPDEEPEPGPSPEASAPPAGDASPAPVAEETAETWSAPLAGDLAALRFVFEIDAGGRLAHLSPELETAVGPSARDALGRSWAELAETLDLDPEDEVLRALGGSAGWSDLPVSWPMADGRRMPLSLSALPMFDRGRALAGFRGLGRANGLPPPLAVDVDGIAEAEGALAGPAMEGEREAPEATEPDAPEAQAPEPERHEPPSIVSAPPPVARLFPRNVVTLRESAPPLLSSSEESAFDEIARRLRDVGVRTSSTPYGDDEPETPGAREPWMINDVETRVAEGARADELLRMLDRLPVGALALKGGAVVYANRATLDLLGHPDLASLAERPADTLFADPLPGGEAAVPTLRLVGLDGAEVEAEAKLSSIFWEGEPATLVSLKRADPAAAAAREAIEREKETASILDTATDGVLTLDGAGRILSVNRSAEALFGFEGGEAIGMLFTLLLAPESRKAAFDYLDRLRANGVAAVMNDGREVLGLVRQGGAIPLYMTIGRIGAHENDRFCAVLRDITPWKKAEEELLAAKRQAERASRQKSEFLTKISHEIRTPLNAIIGFAEVMMEERFGPVGSPRYKDYLRDIHVSGGHLVGIVNDLVDIARIESGGIKLDPSPVDLNEIAAQAAALLQPQANRDHVIIRASLARGLPPVMADRRSVRQIMTTLTANAVKLSRPGGQVIVATATTDAGQAVIRIRDAGAGLTKQELARALEPFRPLGEDGDGGSLALPLAKALAEANDAVLTLSSEPGHGTLAEVVFPAASVLAS